MAFKGPNGAGKGDNPRPMSITREEYADKWEKIFGKKKANKALDKIEEGEKKWKDEKK
jgi:hypothetical protein